ERIEDTMADLRRYAAAVVFHGNDHLPLPAPRADADRPLPLAARIYLADRVRRIDDKVHHDLIDLRRIAGDRRQLRIEVERKLRDVLPFVARHRRSAADRMIEVDALHLVARMRELLHSEHDLR